MSQNMFCLKGETILYIGKEIGVTGVYGIPDGLSVKTLTDYSALMSRALDDMIENSCAEMDFNGKAVIDNDLKDMIRKCSSSDALFVLDKREENGVIEQNIIFMDIENKNKDTLVYMRHPDCEKDDYIIRSIDTMGVKRALNDITEVPDVNNYCDIALESGIVENCNISEMINGGCNALLVEVIEKALCGKTKTISARKIVAGKEVASFSSIIDRNMLLAMDMQYEITEDMSSKEYVHFYSIKPESIMEKVFQVMEAS